MEEFIEIQSVLLLGLDRMHNTGCSGDWSCTYLSHHKLESVKLTSVVTNVMKK